MPEDGSKDHSQHKRSNAALPASKRPGSTPLRELLQLLAHEVAKRLKDEQSGSLNSR
ncbi:MAG: hypothetical protein AB7U20_17980 [Planctomycetaceae bacterium]